MPPMERPVRTRVAPSPTGEPHIGNMYAALFCKAFAVQRQGRFILRLEDTDRTRFVPAAVQMLPDALHWLGLDPDEGPQQGGSFGPYVQTERLPTYRQYAEELLARGGGYRCFCTPERLEEMRREQERRKEPPRYDRHCLRLAPDEVQRHLVAGTPYSVRLRIPDDGAVSFDDAVRGTVTFENRVLTDQILLRPNGYPTSHLGIPLDDYLMEVSHVIRAEEWLSSVPYYVLLYHAFGWELPVFAHLSILRNKDRSKMSKRKNPTSVMWYRQQGFLPQALTNFLALLGWSDPDGKEIFSFSEFAANLTLERVVKSAPIFDFTKLEWMNGVYIRAMTIEELADAVQPFLAEPVEHDALLRMLPLVQERMKKLSEVDDFTAFLRHDPNPDTLPFAQAIKRRTPAEIAAALTTLGTSWQQAGPPTSEQWDTAIRALAEQLGWKAGDLFMALRVAITGSNASPPTYDFGQVIGWDAVTRRLQAAIDALLNKRT
ncbi:MAG: glutamate--tRNA ligase [Chloroflexota bacterium]